jgi:hypothetical protein
LCRLQHRRAKSKGAPACPGVPWGLAFETWDPSNLSRRAVDQFPLETLTLLFVISTEAQRSGETSVLTPFPGNVFDRAKRRGEIYSRPRR